MPRAKMESVQHPFNNVRHISSFTVMCEGVDCDKKEQCVRYVTHLTFATGFRPAGEKAGYETLSNACADQTGFIGFWPVTRIMGG